MEINTDLRPIILIPGMFGSVLENEKGEVIWPCKTKWDIFRISTNMIRLWGKSDAQGTFHNFSSDIIHAVPGIKGCSELIPGVESFYCFKQIIDELTKLGYEEGKSLFAFTYDFRNSMIINQNDFKTFLTNLNLKSKPICITHSMGSLVVRFFMHENPDFENHIHGTIAIAPTFDGGNGELMSILDGYDLHYWFLENMTRGIWCSSGMELALHQCSSGYGQSCYVIVPEEDEMLEEQEMFSAEEAAKIWGSIKFLSDEEYSTIEGILLEVLRNPDYVRRDTYYWALRFQEFMKGKFLLPMRISLSQINPNYIKLSKISNGQQAFFTIEKVELKKNKSRIEVAEPETSRTLTRNEKSLMFEKQVESSATSQTDEYSAYEKSDVVKMAVSESEQTSLEEYDEYEPRVVRYAMWVADDSSINVRARPLRKINYIPSDMDYDEVEQSQYYDLCESKFMETVISLPAHTDEENILNLYNKVTPKYSIERLIFGQNKIQHLLHYNIRNKRIDFGDFKFASICGTGKDTVAHSIYDTPIHDYYQLHRYTPRYVYGEGDGTALLITQLSDEVPEKNVVGRKIIKGVSHVGLLGDKVVLDQITEWVAKME